MYNYYCKNCNNFIGEINTNKYHDHVIFCYCIKSKNNKYIYFLDCMDCNKYVGILCTNVCKYCFGENQIIGEKILFNWFLKYKKIIDTCKNYDKKKYRSQIWFFEELTFYK